MLHSSTYNVKTSYPEQTNKQIVTSGTSATKLSTKSGRSIIEESPSTLKRTTISGIDCLDDCVFSQKDTEAINELEEATDGRRLQILVQLVPILCRMARRQENIDKRQSEMRQKQAKMGDETAQIKELKNEMKENQQKLMDVMCKVLDLMYKLLANCSGPKDNEFKRNDITHLPIPFKTIQDAEDFFKDGPQWECWKELYLKM